MEKAHIWEALKTAVDYIDEVISIIRKSKDQTGAKEALMKRFDFDDVQADAIVKIVDTVEPDPELVAKYEARYQEFKRIYPALKPVFNA